VYAVPRGTAPGQANPGGDNHRFNVYDDQMWLIRELIDAWRATGVQDYLTEAEYLTGYVLDGWDCTPDSNGTENGGIPWGPGYVTKHSCSNGPMISPLVWLHEIYKGKDDTVTYGYIEGDGSRATRTVKKADYYLDFASRIYEWQKTWLRRSDGVYHDMRGGCDTGSGGQGCDPRYETVNGVRYRANSRLTTSGGAPLTYNTGSMLSGAADLYRATGKATYLTDVKDLSADSFAYFAKADSNMEGYYSWPLTGSTWNPWFNGVLFRAYADAVNADCTEAEKGVESFQKNLDYGYDKFNHKGFLPVNLLSGWSIVPENNRVNVMFTCAFAAEYAILARYQLEKLN
jgi:predicted alpha-1,6-mannanase (GH76 family)